LPRNRGAARAAAAFEQNEREEGNIIIPSQPVFAFWAY